MTHPAGQVLFQKQELSGGEATAGAGGVPTITIDGSQTFQPIEGFGYTFTGGSAILLNRMKPAAREALLRELFSTSGNGIGVSYLRLSIGASDLSDRVFSYNDLPAGQTDPDMTRFSLEPERKDLLPVLKQILAINPDIKIMASPWSPPVWMKTNGSSKGGSLKPEFYDAYAKYLVKYIQEMQKEGVHIDAITIQNEPLHPGNNPSLLMLPEEQAAFIKRSMGPVFSEAGLKTKILIYDHNADRPDYPITILNDPDARKYVHGSAFHLYGGSIEALSEVHRAYPDKAIYFTEQWVGAPGNLAGDLPWHVKNLIIGATRNWSRTVLEWNLASDPHQQPHTEGGCDQCLGAITIAPNDEVVRNPAYYVIAHASKWVRPGSVRLGSNVPAQLPNVAFRTPDGKKVLVVLNEGQTSQTFAIKSGGKAISATLPAGAVATYVLE
ncbi:glucosylceramidase [Telluribacter humicola]